MKIEKTGFILFLITLVSAYIIFSNNLSLHKKSSLCKKNIVTPKPITKEKLVTTNKEIKTKNKMVNLKIGSMGKHVFILQKNLNKFGYDLNSDGIFGTLTQIAILDFQKKNKLYCDGIVGEKTWEKLSVSPTKRTMYNPKTEIFKPISSSNPAEKFVNNRNSNSSTGYYIWVSTPNTKTYIFKGYNHHWRLIKAMSCTVGKASTPTIKGTFLVGNKGTSFIVKNNPQLMCKYYTQISGNYLFHSVLLYRNGKIANNTLGARASHGCIRLSIKNSKYIYSNIPKKSSIYIS